MFRPPWSLAWLGITSACAALGVRHLGDVAAVVAVADVYDALTMDRVYRPALGPREALAQLEREHLPPGPVAALGAHLGFGTLPVDVPDA